MAKKPISPIEIENKEENKGQTQTTTPSPNMPGKGSNPFLASRGGKIFLGVMAFLVIFTLGYGIWRLSGGSFKPKTACPDATAETRLRDATTANPNDFAAQIEYGNYLYGQCKKFDAAIEVFQKATALANQAGTNLANSEKVKAYLGLGLAYFYGPQNLKEAQTQFKTAIGLQPENSLSLYMLASALKNENPKEAIEYYKKVVALQPNTELGKSAQTAITELTR